MEEPNVVSRIKRNVIITSIYQMGYYYNFLLKGVISFIYFNRGRMDKNLNKFYSEASIS